MSDSVYLPCEQVSGPQPDLDLAADYLELKAVLSEDKISLSQDIIDAMEVSSDYEFENVTTEIEERERVVTDTMDGYSRERIYSRPLIPSNRCIW